MKVTRDQEGFQKVTIVLETEQEVLNLSRLTCDGMYDFLKERYGTSVVGKTDLIAFKGILHQQLIKEIR